jgi:hypothetical protein
MLSTDLKVFAARANGRCSATQITSGVVQNVLPHVTSAQRTAGLVTDVKTFWGLTNTDNLPLLDPEAYNDAPTISPDDYCVKWLSGQRTTVAGLATEISSADIVGTAYLKEDIAISDLTLTVTVKNAALLPGGTYDIFRDGQKIKVCSHSNSLASDGAEEIHEIDGTPTCVGLDVTITVTEAQAAQAGVNEVKQVRLVAVREAPAPASAKVEVQTPGQAGVNESNGLVFTTPSVGGQYNVFFVADGSVSQTQSAVAGVNELQRLTVSGSLNANPASTAEVSTVAQGSAGVGRVMVSSLVDMARVIS